MKAGLMEIADVFAVNKADHPDAPAMVRALRQTLHLRPPAAGRALPAVCKVSALEDVGVESLLDALDAHRAVLDATWDATRAERLRRRVQRLVEHAWRASFWTAARRADLARAVEALDPADRAPHRLAHAVGVLPGPA
jgi:LAO/AO transport system kinase